MKELDLPSLKHRIVIADLIQVYKNKMINEIDVWEFGHNQVDDWEFD